MALTDKERKKLRDDFENQRKGNTQGSGQSLSAIRSEFDAYHKNGTTNNHTYTTAVKELKRRYAMQDGSGNTRSDSAVNRKPKGVQNASANNRYDRTSNVARNENANNVLSKASNWARDRLNETKTEYAGKDYSDLFDLKASDRRANRIAIDKIKSGQIGMEMATGGQSQTLKDIQKTLSAKYGRQVSEKEAMEAITSRKDQLDVETYQDKQAESKKNYDELTKKEKFQEIARKGLEKTSQMPEQRISAKGEAIPMDDVPVVFKNRDQYEIFQSMNDDEKNTYGYLLETEGAESAADYIEYARRDVNARRSEEMYREKSEFAKDHPFIANAQRVGINMGSGLGMIEAYRQGIENAVTGEYKPIDVNSRSFDATTLNKAIIEGTENRIDEAMGGNPYMTVEYMKNMAKGMTQEEALANVKQNKLGNNIVKFLYQTGTSMLDSSAGRLLGRAYLPMMGLGAGSAMVQDVVNRGGNTRQAIAAGTMAAAAEYVSENLGLDRITEAWGTGAKTRVEGSAIKKLITNFFQQAVPEGLEEVVSDIVNETTDQIVMGDKSEYKTYLEEAMANGRTEDQAKRDYYLKKLGDTALSFAGGALSGGVMGTGAFAVGYAHGNKVGQVLNNQQGMGNYMLKLASRLEGSKSAEMASHIGEGELTNQQAADLYWQVDADIEEAKANGVDTDAIEREVQEETKVTEEQKNAVRMAAEEETVANQEESVAKEEESVVSETENVAEDQEFRQKLLETAQKAVETEEKREKGPVELTGDDFHEGPSIFDKSEIQKGTNYKGTAAEITGINKVENGKIYFDVDTGTTTEVVEAMDLDLDGDLLHMVQSADDLGESGKRNLLLEYKGKNEGVSVDAYVKAFKMIYDGAALNIKKDTLFGFNIEGISQAQREAAYEAGKADANSNAEEIINRLNLNKANATQGGKVIYATRQVVPENVRNYIQAMADISDANFVIVDTLSDGTKPGANGSYLNGTVTIALDHRNTLNALINHELVHHMVANTAFGQGFVEFVCKNIAASKNMSMEDLIDTYRDAYQKEYDKSGRKISRLEIMEEIAADSTELFGATENSQEIIEEMVKENRSMAEAVYEFLKDFLKKLKEAFAGMNPRSAAAIRLNESVDAAKEAERLFYEALFQAGKEHRNAVEKNAGNNKGTETIETKSKFSMDAPVEMTKDLVAVHNINSSNLRKQLKLDGFPMPSIAVTKAELGHENFGDISFIFGRDTIDPKNKKNKVYAADAWTPTFPAIEYEGNEKVTNKLSDALWEARQKGMPSRFAAEANNITSDPGYALKVYGGESGVIDRALENDGFKALYLDSIGKPVQVMTKEVRNEVEPAIKERCQKLIDKYNIDELYHMQLNEVFDKHGEDILRMILSKDAPLLQKLDEGYDWQQSRMTKNLITGAIRKAYEFSQGTLEKTETVEDYQAEKKFIEDNLDQNGFEKWVNDNLKGIEKSKGIWNGKEIFTPSGNRRSFKQTHLEVNATNIVKAMLAQNDDVRNVAGFNGPKSIRAVVVDEFKSIADIKKNSNKLASIGEAEFNAAQDELANRLSNVIGGIQSNKQIFDNAFIDIDNVGNGIMDAVRTSIDPARIKRTLEGYGRIVTMDQAEEIADICQTIKDMPVHMFEAKPLRVVSYDEIQKVIIPQTLESDLKDTLQDMSDQHGFDVVEYDETVEGDRKNKLNSMDDVKFSLSITEKDGSRRRINNLGDALTISQHREFMSEIDNHEADKYTKSKDGDCIVPIDNKLVYTDFNKDDPGISKIIAFRTNNFNAIAGATSTILDEEKGILKDGESRKIIENLFGKRFYREYTNEMFGNPEKYDRQEERGKRRSDAYHARKRKERGRLHIDDYRRMAREQREKKAREKELAKLRRTNWKLSIEVDTEGRNLTEQQKEFFKDSKAVDDNGNLLVLYHGTSQAGFTEFDISREKPGFFTTSIDDAHSYGGNDGENDRKMFNPNEKEEVRTSTGGNYMIGESLRFDSEEDREEFLRKNKNAENYKDVWEIKQERDSIEDDYWGEDEYDDLMEKLYKVEEESKKIEKAYARYEAEHSKTITIGELLEDPEEYDIGDIVRAIYEIDENTPVQEIIDDAESKEDALDSLLESLTYMAGEDEDINDIPVKVRLRDGEEGQIVDRKNKRTYEVYADLKNPFVIDCGGLRAEKSNFYEAIEHAKQNEEYDGVIANNVRVGRYKNNATSVVVFDKNSVKLVSNENPTSSNDIRYSLQDTADVDFDKLIEENKQQKEVIKHLNGVIESMTTYVPDQKQMRKVGQYILKKYNSNYKLNTFMENMTRIWDYVTNSKNVDPQMVASATANMAKMILQESTQVDRTLSDQYKDLTDKIRNTKITISEPMRGDLDRAGGYRQFVRDNFGKMRIGNGGLNVDSFFQELAAEYPEWFNAEEVTNEADEMIRISEVLKMLQPQVTNIYGMNMDQAATDLAYDIYESIYNIGQHTSSKKWEKEAALYKQKRAELEQKYKEEYEANYQVLKERSAMVDRNESDKILQVKAKYQSSLENRAIRQREGDDRTRLLKALRRIHKMNLTPENMKIVDSLVGDIDLVAKSMRGDTQYNLEALRDRYYQAMKEDPDFVPSPTIEEKIARLDKQKISDMGIEGVRTLLEAVLEFEHKIRTDKRQIDSEYKKTNYEMATEIIGEFDSSKGVNLNSTGARALNKYVTMSSSAIREMRKMAGYALDSKWEMLGNQLNDGQLKMTKFQQDASKHFQDFVDKNEKWLKDIHGPKAERINIGQVDGKDVFITPAMRISLYLHSLNNANLRHIVGGTMLQDGEMVKFEGGGIKVPDLDLLAKGNVNEAYANGVRVKLTKSGLNQILNGMTEREKQYANLAHTFLDEMCKNAINETSLKLDGFEKALVNNYFPIRTDSNFVQSEFESIVSDTSIEGMGMLKKRAGGTNPIMLEDVINVIERQTKSVSKYYGLAIPVRNFNKIYNVTEQGYTTSVKEALQKKWGTEGSMYMENLLADIQGSRATPHSFLDDIRGNYAGAVLTLNLSVTLKQAGSYPTAAAVVGWKPLIKALNVFNKVDRATIDQYSPLLWYRDQGNATSELADMAKTKTWQDHFPKAIQKNVFNWIQNMDSATVKRLWLAAEYYVQDQGIKKGSENYYQEVAKVYNRIIEETQPNYTTMQRPDILRNPNNAVKMMTMFKTQSLQNFNIVADAIGEYKARHQMFKDGKITKEQMDASSKKLSKALSSQIVAAAVIGVMVKAVDLVMHKRKKLEDEEGNITWLEALKSAGQNMASTMAGSFLGGSELYDFIYKTITGEKYYGITASNFETLTDLSEAAEGLTSELAKALTGETTPEKVMKKATKLAENLTKATGIPLTNAKNLIDAGTKWVQDAKMKEFFGSDKTYSYDDLYEVMKINDQEMYDKIYQWLLDDGKSEKGIQNAISKLRNQEIKESDDFQEAVKVKKAGGNVDAYRDRIVREYEKYGATKQSIGTLITNAAK